MKLYIIKKIALKLKNFLINTKLSKPNEVAEEENTINESNQDIIAENKLNEAIEAKLAYLIASSPSSSPSTMSVTISPGTSLSFYSGCQTAEPQVA